MKTVLRGALPVLDTSQSSTARRHIQQLLLLIPAIVLLAGGASAGETDQGSAEARAGVLAAIEDFAEGADQQDAARIERSLHESSWQFLPGAPGVRTLDQKQYLGMIASKRIGGQDREMTVDLLDITEDYMATARVQLQAGSRVFVHHLGLMKVDDRWQILSVLTLAGNVTD